MRHQRSGSCRSRCRALPLPHLPPEVVRKNLAPFRLTRDEGSNRIPSLWVHLLQVSFSDSCRTLPDFDRKMAHIFLFQRL
jgi:hypothetical protein